MKTKLFCLLLCLVLTAGLLTGCTVTAQVGQAPSAPAEASGTADPGQTSSGGDEEAGAATEAAPETAGPAEISEADLAHSLTWAKAFRDTTLPEGWVTPDVIAFYCINDDDSVSILNVPKDEVYADQPAYLPRTHYFEQFMPESLASLYPVLDYALTHGYSRFSLPTTDFNWGDIQAGQKYLDQTYRINESGVYSFGVQSFELDSGETLTYMLVSLAGMETKGMIHEFREGYAAAVELVESIPEGASEYETALYLYRYLADNVEYHYDDYYSSGGWSLLYDTLIRHSTVCSGYAEALYYLYNMAGIDCFTIEGFISRYAADGSYDSGGHIWNIARIDGTYYQFDSTWDAGCLFYDYAYFGVSDEYMLENHTENVADFCLGYAPACESSLLPDKDLDFEQIFDWETDDRCYNVYWYFRLLNLRNAAPLRILEPFGEDPLTETGREDGWIRTDYGYSSFYNYLLYILDEDEADRFCSGCFRSEGGKLACLEPDPQTPCYRLCSMELQPDGSLIAEAYRMCEATGETEPVTLRVTFSYFDKYSYVQQVEELPGS